ncbi:two-component system response regulator KdpE [Aquabacterium sp. CECT 9606]|uniref:two-component system response regulator KdpE n=1 Tax=Aquabacterium sp. CECT 9606 TaxID=2845822 RepID=UPI001E383625|nr:two-component system response regulator KdpE [Aquabacterium sp. CECT 9606]CAH0354596.1 KDP operon transcriptional regulatory protein KdpE [Aquabacterium sp. CECT 9606]
MTQPTVLVVEDDPHIRRFVHAALESEGCHVVDSDTMAQGLISAGTRQPDMVVLDLGLPDGNGLQFVQDLRTWSSMPVLVLSARTAETDKIEVLDAGADDYLTKPFSVGELLARVRALLRRGRKGTEAEQPLFSFSDVEVDLVRRQVTRAGQPVHLTPIEYRLLGVLLANAGKVMTHRHLLRDVWGPAYVDSNHYLRIYVGHLRHKLENDPAQPRHFLTETGVGYRFHSGH